METTKHITATKSIEAIHDQLLSDAIAAGIAAAEACVPIPMIPVQHANPFDDSSPIVKVYEPVLGGVCGFAWIVLRPANSKFANYCKTSYAVRTHKNYGGGLAIWIGAYGQSMTRKEAYASAFAKVLRDAGLNAYAESRMD